MILDRTLPAIWQLRGADVPALASVTSRAHTVVVDDVEYLCAAITREVSAGNGPYRPRTYSQMDDLLAFLLGQVSMLAERYDPTKGRAVHDPFTDGFRAWLYVELKRDAIDECRHLYGRAGQKHDLIDFRPYEREEENEHARLLDQPDPNEDGVRSFTDRFFDAVGGIAQDDPDTWFDGRGWALERRNRKANRRAKAIGRHATEPPPRRDGSPGREELAA